MKCCQCQGIEMLFDDKTALKELEHYRQKGPSKTTRLLLEAVRANGLDGKTLLDIGGGVGAIQHELWPAGLSHITNVDASSAYLAAARAEAERQGYVEQASYHHGDFVDLAERLEPVDIVTLDKVICCYHDMEALVRLSSAQAGALYALIFPRDTWWMKVFQPIFNAFFRVRRHPFRVFLHPTEAVDALIRSNGFEQRYHRRAGIWQVMVYARLTS
ncbi:MAG: methyltransferase domain-containing protein [Anaerolineae bacterium]